MPSRNKSGPGFFHFKVPANILWILMSVFICSKAFSQTPEYKFHTSINIIKKENFTPKTDSILQKSIFFIDSIVNTENFRKAIISANFVNVKGCSNQEILRLFLGGGEISKPILNDTMEFELAIYPNQNGDNIGSTYNSRKIVSSEKYIFKNGARCYAAHLIHEYCHTIGYDGFGFAHIHNTSNGRKREKCLSVPYVIGEIARKQLGIKTCHFECEGFEE
ncbi:MAG: hypothetical protein H7329_03745 [Opitutaceae bacterium]|nr:hypothetical protein [Cytophagales bacterium]